MIVYLLGKTKLLVYLMHQNFDFYIIVLILTYPFCRKIWAISINQSTLVISQMVAFHHRSTFFSFGLRLLTYYFSLVKNLVFIVTPVTLYNYISSYLNCYCINFMVNKIIYYLSSYVFLFVRF